MADELRDDAQIVEENSEVAGVPEVEEGADADATENPEPSETRLSTLGMLHDLQATRKRAQAAEKELAAIKGNASGAPGGDEFLSAAEVEKRIAAALEQATQELKNEAAAKSLTASERAFRTELAAREDANPKTGYDAVMDGFTELCNEDPELTVIMERKADQARWAYEYTLANHPKFRQEALARENAQTIKRLAGIAGASRKVAGSSGASGPSRGGKNYSQMTDEELERVIEGT